MPHRDCGLICSLEIHLLTDFIIVLTMVKAYKCLHVAFVSLTLVTSANSVISVNEISVVGGNQVDVFISKNDDDDAIQSTTTQHSRTVQH